MHVSKTKVTQSALAERRSLRDRRESTNDVQGQMAALLKAQAIIEFSPDGRVVSANDRMLDLLGYRLDDITGQHHDTLCPRQGSDAAPWDRLLRGEAIDGEARFRAKGDRDCWLQAIYTPVLDSGGRTSRVVAYATDISARKQQDADTAGQLAAIGKAQAVIAFSLDGRILEANENFLGTVGYSMDEIRGQHHSMFVDPAARQSVEYRMFWDKLGRGEYDSGQYRRVAKGGRELWLQASYNPIFDLHGKPFKVVKYATDITAQKLQAADFDGQLSAIDKAQAVIEFSLDGAYPERQHEFSRHRRLQHG